MHGVTSEEIRRLVAAIDYSEVLTITAGATVVAMRRFLVEKLESLGWRP